MKEDAMRKIVQATAVLCLLLLAAAPVTWVVRAGPAVPAAGTTELVSVSSDESQGDGDSVFPAVSAGGLFVAFHSHAPNLVSGDGNLQSDVFIRDRTAGTTELVSVSSDEVQGDDGSFGPAITPDGRFVAFWSQASNLVGDDTNGFLDVFVRDRLLGTTERVSVTSDEGQANSGSNYPAISADGLYVAFRSNASNLVDGDTNTVEDIFVRDRVNGTTERVSVASDESQGDGISVSPSISADGRFVAFNSAASNLVVGDTNNWDDVFVRDREAGTTERISVTSNESQQNFPSLYPTLSANGRFVIFLSFATNLVSGDTNNVADIFVRDRTAGTTERVSVASDQSQANNASELSAISADGRYAIFRSDATNLVVGDTNTAPDIFIHDRLFRFTERLSVASDGSQANDASGQPSISADGRYAAFRSIANDLVGVDTNGFLDVFVRDRGEPPPLMNLYLPVVTR
jgi:Tol biopolymer transport system component